jgi:ABC-type sugar transport system substrate-binding protein
MEKTVFVLLIGDKDAGHADHYQLLQEETALAEGRRAGIDVEVAFAPAFDQLRALRRRLNDAGKKPVDAVITEPASVATMDLMLRDLQGKAGLVLLNTWSPTVETSAAAWGRELPFGTVSTDQSAIGQIQGRQLSAIVPQGGIALCVTGPRRSSAAEQRLQGTKSALRGDIRLLDTQAGDWTENAGTVAVTSWYGVFKARNESVHAVAGQSDELVVGAMAALKAVDNPTHRQMFAKVKTLGVDACPSLGKRLVDAGTLTASIVNPPNTGPAIESLVAFWKRGKALPLRAFTAATPYPANSI